MDRTKQPLTKTSNHSYILFGGLAALAIILLLVVIIVFITRDNVNHYDPPNSLVPPVSNTISSDKTTANPEPASISWSFDGEVWKNISKNPIKCDDPLTIKSPVDMSLVTGILYPGQTRGGDFKAHGGFRLDNSNNNINVYLPISATIWRGSKYLEEGEYQIILDFISDCGIMIRFDHLLTLSNDLKFYEDQLPLGGENESRTTNFSNIKKFDAGSLIAVEIGHKSPKKNVGFDLGVYDLRTKNEISLTNSAWADAHANKKEQAYFAICWLNNLEEPDKTIAKSFPGPESSSSGDGKTSDYCK